MSFWRHKQLSKNKHFEIQIENFKDWTSYFLWDFSWTRNNDHAGVRFNIEICSFYFQIEIYDCRHWDYDNKCWKVYD